MLKMYLAQDAKKKQQKILQMNGVQDTQNEYLYSTR